MGGGGCALCAVGHSVFNCGEQSVICLLASPFKRPLRAVGERAKTGLAQPVLDHTRLHALLHLFVTHKAMCLCTSCVCMTQLTHILGHLRAMSCPVRANRMVRGSCSRGHVQAGRAGCSMYNEPVACPNGVMVVAPECRLCHACATRCWCPRLQECVAHRRAFAVIGTHACRLPALGIQQQWPCCCTNGCNLGVPLAWVLSGHHSFMCKQCSNAV